MQDGIWLQEWSHSILKVLMAILGPSQVFEVCVFAVNHYLEVLGEISDSIVSAYSYPNTCVTGAVGSLGISICSRFLIGVLRLACLDLI